MLANVKSMLRAIVVGTAVLTVTSVSAVAWERVPYSAEAVAEAQTSSVPFIIHVHAVWCSTCQAQDNVLAQLDSDPRFADLLIIRVHYDSKKHVMRLFQGTGTKHVCCLPGGDRDQSSICGDELRGDQGLPAGGDAITSGKRRAALKGRLASQEHCRRAKLNPKGVALVSDSRLGTITTRW